MFTILNRLRGTYGYFAKVTAFIIGVLFFIFTHDIYVSLGLMVAYVLGESFGWGKWMGGMYSNNRGYPLVHQLNDIEGRNNGIHFLANLISPEMKNYYVYCFTALWIRGMYWFGITMLPLVLGGYLTVTDYMAITVLIGYGFPISVKLGMYSETKFNLKNKYFGMNGFWEHSEVWYGLIQDIGLILIILNISMI